MRYKFVTNARRPNSVFQPFGVSLACDDDGRAPLGPSARLQSHTAAQFMQGSQREPRWISQNESMSGIVIGRKP